MKRTIQKYKNYQQAEEVEIVQQITMTPEQRQDIAKKLRQRVYGKKAKDVKEAQSCD